MAGQWAVECLLASNGHVVERQMIVFEALFAYVYGFLFSQRVPGLMEVTSIVLLVAGVVWAAKRHSIAPVKHAEP